MKLYLVPSFNLFDNIHVWVKQSFRVDLNDFDGLDQGLKMSISNAIEDKLASFDEAGFSLKLGKFGPAECGNCIFWREDVGENGACQRDLEPPEGGPCLEWENFDD